MSIYRRSPTGPWWYLFKVAGVRYRASTGTGDRREAQAIERRARAEIEALAPRGDSGGIVDLAQVAEWDVTRSRARGSSVEWCEALLRQWADLCEVLDARTPITKVTTDAIEKYVLERRDQVSGETIARHLQTLRRGLEVARKKGKLARLPSGWPEVARQSTGRGKGRLIPTAVLVAWLSELQGDAYDEAFVVVLTGLRAWEIRRLEWAWVERAPDGAPTPWQIRLPAPGTKGRRERLVGLPIEGFEVLERRAHARPKGPLFEGDHKTARRLAATRVKWPRGISLRDLRHTHASLAVLGTDPRSVQAALGHGRLETTERYLTATRASAASACVSKAIRGHSGGATPRPRCSKPEVHGKRATGLEPATLSLGSWVISDERQVYVCTECLSSALVGLGMHDLVGVGSTGQEPQLETA